MIIKFHMFEESLNSAVLSLSNVSIVFFYGEEKTDVRIFDVFSSVPVCSIVLYLKFNIEMFAHYSMLRW